MVDTDEQISAISIYLDLVPGRVADLSVVASTALCWDALIKEFATIIDPSLDLRVELVSGDPGSLWLKGLIRATSKVKKEHPTLMGVLAAAVSAFLIVPVSHLSEDIWHKIFDGVGVNWDGGISNEDLKKIAKSVSDNLKNQNAVRCKNEIYRRLGSDDAIRGLASTIDISQKPKSIIKRSEFQSRIDAGDDKIETIKSRDIIEHKRPVILIRPVLVSEPRSWRFQKGEYQFSALMEDRDFLSNIASGHTGIELRQGVAMVVDLRISQEWSNGVWINKKTSVLKVWPSPPVTGHQLELPHKQSDKDGS